MALALQEGRVERKIKKGGEHMSRISEALRKALEMGVGETVKGTESAPVFPITAHKAVPVVPTPSKTLRTITLRELLINALRPRPVSRSGKVNWAKTYERMRRIADYINLFSHKGDLRAEEAGGEFDLLEAFYEVYPEARQEGVSLIPLYYPNLLIDLNSLENVLDPHSPVFRTYFSRLVVIPGTTSSRVGGSYEFSRLREEVTRAYLALVEPKGGEKYKEIIKDLLEAYLSYASKVRSLPKPRLGEDGGEDRLG